MGSLLTTEQENNSVQLKSYLTTEQKDYSGQLKSYFTTEQKDNSGQLKNNLTTEQKDNSGQPKNNLTTEQKDNSGQPKNNLTTEQKDNSGQPKNNLTTEQKDNSGQPKNNLTTEQKDNSGQPKSNLTTEQKDYSGQPKSNFTTEQKDYSGQPKSDFTTEQKDNSGQPKSDLTTEQKDNSGQLKSDLTTEQENNSGQLKSDLTTEQENNSGQLKSDLTTEQENNSGQLKSDLTTEQEKCYDPRDTTLTFVEGDDDLDFLCEDFKSLRAKMSCGHAATPMSLTNWCEEMLKKGESKFVCGQTDCDVEWPFEEVRKMALLTPEEIEHFEKKLFNNAAKDFLDVKACPGCKSCVVRTDLHDLSVQCPVCTAKRRQAFMFCWQCLKRWKGPAPRSDRCGNDECHGPLEILKSCPDITFEDVKGVAGCPSIRACPTCGLLVEHNKTQCKNVVCARCKVEFCFVCLKLTEECMDENNLYYELCSSGVTPRQTSIPVWQRT